MNVKQALKHKERLVKALNETWSIIRNHNSVQKVINILSIISLVFLVAVALVVVMAGPVWLLWNWLMPDIFGLPEITFLQALGMLVLSNFLFKSTNINNSKK
jgi:hypothetical protein